MEYVKDFNLDVHVKIFKIAIRANSEIDYAKIVNVFNFTFKNIVSNWCNNYMGDYPNYNFAKLQLVFNKKYRKVQSDEQVYLQLKNMKQKKNEKMEVYYERLLKLANSLQQKTTYSFLTTILKYGLQPYLHVTTCMKRETLQQHKEATLVCEERISNIKAISNLVVP